MSEQESGSIESVVAGPVAGSERIDSLDILRGVAIFGILVMNIYAFAMPFPSVYLNPLLMGGTDTINMGVWFVTHILFEAKFLSIFAMLFGAGIVLMTLRAEERDIRFTAIFYRRQFWLMCIGALHAYFLWIGDILFLYGIIGMLAYLFRKRKPTTLIIIACLLLPVTPLLNVGMGALTEQFTAEVVELTARQEAGEVLTDDETRMLERWEAQNNFMAPDAEALQNVVDTHLGSYAEITANRIPTAVVIQLASILIQGPWQVGAFMLLGMALMKMGVLSGKRSADFYRRMMLIFYAIGLPLTAYSAIDLQAHEFDAVYQSGLGGISNYFGAILVALGHIGLVMLLLTTGFVTKLLRRLAAVGRMALSNYLMHSMILTTVFYGYGLGLYGSVSRIGQMGFVVGVIALQLIYSPWWLARYRFGPVEWLWRSLTYWKRQPMLRE
jgi:uncharacterized protein